MIRRWFRWIRVSCASTLAAGGIFFGSMPLAFADISVQAQPSALVSSLQSLAPTTGLYFFFRSDCPYCHRSLEVLRELQLTTGIHITAVSLDGQGIDDELFPNYLIDNGQARALGVIETPTFFLVRPPNPGNISLIGAGYMPISQLETEIVEQALQRGWIGPPQSSSQF